MLAEDLDKFTAAEDVKVCRAADWSGLLPRRVQASMLERRPDRAWFRSMLASGGGPLIDLHRHEIC